MPLCEFLRIREKIYDKSVDLIKQYIVHVSMEIYHCICVPKTVHYHFCIITIADEICISLGIYVAQICSLSPTFRRSLPVPSSRVEQSKRLSYSLFLFSLVCITKLFFCCISVI